ncbi:MAG: hypothetical protein AAGH38_10650 [Pseudomonadota bacterium]
MNDRAEVQLAYGLSDQDVENIREHLRNPPRSNYGFSATPEEAAALKEHFENEGMSFTEEEVLGSEGGQSDDDQSEGVDMTELADIDRIKRHFSDGVCNAVDEGYTFTASPDAPWSPTLGDFAGKDRNWRRLWGPTPEASADFLMCTGANICKRTYERFSGLELRVQAGIDLAEAVAALIETEWSENFFTREQFEAYRGAPFEAKAQSSAGVTFSGYHSDLVCLYPGPQNDVTQGPEHFNDGAPIRLSGSAGGDAPNTVHL